VIRSLQPLPRAVVAAAVLAVVAAGCGTGTTGPLPQPAAPSAAPSRASTAAGFPADQDGAVLAAAKLFTQTVTTYDHTKLADQRAALLPLAGEPLKGQLAASLADDGDFAKTVAANSSDARGAVLDLGLVSREANRAVVVLFVDQQVSSPAGTTTQRLRERLTLGRNAAGQWLATKIETL
jgi:hypothetical protein